MAVRIHRAVPAAAATAAVALLLFVVALASRPEASPTALRLGEDPLRVIMDALAYLLFTVVALWLGVMIWVLWPRPDEELPQLPPRRRRSLLGTAIVAALAVVAASWLRSTNFRGLTAPGPGGLAGVPNLAPATSGTTGRTSSGVDWAAAAIVALLLAVAGLLAWRAWRRLAGVRRPGRQTALTEVRAILDDAIEDVLAVADPRRAVIAAWTRLERVLARHNLPRDQAEAPLEYAARAGAEIGVHAAALGRLAGLFEWARFSLHEVTPAMRQEALEGLVAVRDDLRNAAT
jgi:hypothetical protein